MVELYTKVGGTAAASTILLVLMLLLYIDQYNNWNNSEKKYLELNQTRSNLESNQTAREELQTAERQFQQSDEGLRLFLFLISVLIVANIFFWTEAIAIYVKKRKRPVQEHKISDTIRDENGFPSLAMLQFLTWTIVVFFAFLTVFFINWYNGGPLLPDGETTDEDSFLPINLLILMGISVSVPIVSSGLSQVKYGTRPSTSEPKEYDRRPLSSMLMEDGRLTVSRFQMFGWTWITVGTYLIVFGSGAMNSESQSLKIPDVPDIYVVLMGISQGAYLGGKMVIRKSFFITKVLPKVIFKKKDSAPATIDIMVTNFGSDLENRVYLEPKNKDENGRDKKSEDDWYGPYEPDKEETSENLISIKIDKDELLDIKACTYFVRVESKGMLTDKMIDSSNPATIEFKEGKDENSESESSHMQPTASKL